MIKIIAAFLSVFTWMISVNGRANVAPICSNSYTRDKDSDSHLDLDSVLAKSLMATFVECGLTSVANNHWNEIGPFSLDQIRNAASSVEVIYVSQIPTELLPIEQNLRNSGFFHVQADGHWQIELVPAQIKTHYTGEIYLLLFHELVSTLDPELDRNYSLTLEYETKMLQADTTEFENAKIKDIIFPLTPQRSAVANGVLTSGGGDLDSLWLKRQLRNFVSDFGLTQFLHDPSELRRVNLSRLYNIISYCPIQMARSEEDRSKAVFADSASPAPLLTVGQDYLLQTLDRRMSETGDIARAKPLAYIDGFQRIVAELLNRSLEWSGKCAAAAGLRPEASH